MTKQRVCKDMFQSVHNATSQLAWLKGNKGFVYTEAQPTGIPTVGRMWMLLLCSQNGPLLRTWNDTCRFAGACSYVQGFAVCPMSGTSFTAATGTTTFNVPEKPKP